MPVFTFRDGNSKIYNTPSFYWLRYRHFLYKFSRRSILRPRFNLILCCYRNQHLDSFKIVINSNGKRRKNMTDDRVKDLWNKGVQLMAEQYTWAEAILQVLREDTGCDWSNKEDIKRYFKDQIYKDTCYRQFEWAVRRKLVGIRDGIASRRCRRDWIICSQAVAKWIQWSTRSRRRDRRYREEVSSENIDPVVP